MKAIRSVVTERQSLLVGRILETVFVQVANAGRELRVVSRQHDLGAFAVLRRNRHVANRQVPQRFEQAQTAVTRSGIQMLCEDPRLCLAASMQRIHGFLAIRGIAHGAHPRLGVTDVFVERPRNRFGEYAAHLRFRFDLQTRGEPIENSLAGIPRVPARERLCGLQADQRRVVVQPRQHRSQKSFITGPPAKLFIENMQRTATHPAIARSECAGELVLQRSRRRCIAKSLRGGDAHDLAGVAKKRHDRFHATLVHLLQAVGAIERGGRIRSIGLRCSGSLPISGEQRTQRHHSKLRIAERCLKRLGTRFALPAAAFELLLQGEVHQAVDA